MIDHWSLSNLVNMSMNCSLELTNVVMMSPSSKHQGCKRHHHGECQAHKRHHWGDNNVRITAPTSVAIYNGDSMQSTKIVTLRQHKIKEGEEDCRLVQSYTLDCNFDCHSCNKGWDKAPNGNVRIGKKDNKDKNV